MKSLRRKIALLLIAAFTMSIVLLSGCGGGGEEVKPEEVVSQFTAALNEGDFKTMKDLSEESGDDALGDYETKDDFVKDLAGEGISEETAGKLVDVLLAAKVTPKEAKIDGDKAVVPVTIEAIDFEALMGTIMEKMMASVDMENPPETDEEINALTDKIMGEVFADPDSLEKVTNETNVNLVKKDGKWVIASDNDEFLSNLVGGMDAFGAGDSDDADEDTSE